MFALYAIVAIMQSVVIRVHLLTLGATRDTAQKMGVPYVDVRTTTLAAIPFYRMYYLG